MSPSIVVLGAGNLLFRDDGIGVHLLKLFGTTTALYPNVELIDAGISLDALMTMGNPDKLIILDAVNGGEEAGTIYRFALEELGSETESIPVSLHQIGILDSLKMLELIGKKPREVIIIGIEPKILDWGVGLSPEIENKLPQLLKLAEEEINRNNECSLGVQE